MADQAMPVTDPQTAQDPRLIELNECLVRVGAAKASHERLVSEYEEATEAALKPINEAHLPKIDAEEETLKRAIARIEKIVGDDWDELMAQIEDPKVKKTLFLREGTIQVRDNPEKLEVVNEKAALRSLRRRRWMKRFTTRKVTISINKTELKKKENRADAAMVEGIKIVREETLVIKPNRLQAELLRPFRTVPVTLSRPKKDEKQS